MIENNRNLSAPNRRISVDCAQYDVPEHIIGFLNLYRRREFCGWYNNCTQ